MGDVALLDATLRDGGYINDWDFSHRQIEITVENLIKSKIDYIEMGYLTSITSAVRGTQFDSVSSVSRYVPGTDSQTKFVAMADVSLFDVSELEERTKNTIDGIRVVFYKRQIEQAFRFCKGVLEKGYDLFLQPMVTVDYSLEEFSELIKWFNDSYSLYAVSVVDSFGCMNETEVFRYITVLDNILPKEVKLGFHGHNNMNLALLNAIALRNIADRDIIIDCTVNGMGRGAGNLCTELIADYCSKVMHSKYEVNYLINIMSEVTEPIAKEHKWGYSPYYLLTAKYRAHPNFANFLLSQHDMSVAEFNQILKLIPRERLTKCTRSYVEELYQTFKKNEKEA